MKVVIGKMSFVHLHVHSCYSLLDGVARPKELINAASSLDQKALALTDHGVMYGVIEFKKYAKLAGIKPILGSEVYLAKRKISDKVAKIDDKRTHLTILAKNKQGYNNLIKIVSKSFTEGFYYKPRVDYDLLDKYKKDLIVLSGCYYGIITQKILQNKYSEALENAIILKQIFGESFYIELQNHKTEEEKIIIKELVKIANEIDAKIVATNDVHYVKREDAKIQDILLAIETRELIKNKNRIKFDTDELYLKSNQEMKELFSDLPEAITNSEKIAKLCEEIDFDKAKFPVYKNDSIANEKSKSNSDYLQEICETNLKLKYSGESYEEAKSRLTAELKIIKKMNFTDYFLIVWDFINYARKKSIKVGPGRGSVAGSITAFCLNITTVDPIKYGLIFERFLNEKRTSMPDIDVDFCYERRHEVVEYVIEKYGKDRVASIVTFGTMGAKQSIRDVGRVLGFNYPYVNSISKQIPEGINMTINKALDISIELKQTYQKDKTAKTIIDIAQKIEGLPRHTSVHAAGIIITEEPITDYIPIKITGNVITTQFDMETIEKLGILKIDFLGLRTLTIIEDTVKKVAPKGEEIDIEKINLEDKKIYKMINSFDVTGVFQIEGDAIKKKFLSKMQPKKFEDIVAAISIYRPGPIQSFESYLKNRDSKIIKYDHFFLTEILSPTYGIIIYQEQVIKIVEKFAGYDASSADIFRRSISKRNMDLIEKEKSRFLYGDKDVIGAINNNISEETAKKVFAKILEMSKYAFNKSHAVAYSKISYQTAWLKFYYPLEFFSSLMTNLYSTETIDKYVKECRKNKIELLGPDINKSGIKFDVENEKIRFPLNSVKNIGTSFIKIILEEREKRPYKGFDDFFERMKNSKNRKNIEWLIKGGAFDSFTEDRYELLNKCEKFLKNKTLANEMHGQINMFDSIEGKKNSHKNEKPDVREILEMEKDSLATYVSSHPIRYYEKSSEEIISISKIKKTLNNLDKKTLSDFEKNEKKVKIFGVITKIYIKQNVNIIQIEDETEKINVIYVNDKLENRKIKIGTATILEIKINSKDEKFPFILDDIPQTQ